MASFAGATFLELAGYPSWSARDLLIVADKPGGRTPAIKSIGADVQRVSISALCTSLELYALADKVQEVGLLIFSWETHNAFLESMGEAQRVGMENLYQVSLNLIRTSGGGIASPETLIATEADAALMTEDSDTLVLE